LLQNHLFETCLIYIFVLLKEIYIFTADLNSGEDVRINELTDYIGDQYRIGLEHKEEIRNFKYPVNYKRDDRIVDLLSERLLRIEHFSKSALLKIP